MQTHAGEALHPEWKLKQTALLYADRGKIADAQSSTHPVIQPILSAEQARQSFDEITYFKGGAVVAMLEAYIGPDVFRQGVRNYLKADAYGNTTDSDLWTQEQSVAGKPILAIERDFIRQPGVPLIDVKQERGHSRLSTRRFYADPANHPSSDETWQTLLSVSLGANHNELRCSQGRQWLTVPHQL